MLLIAFLFYFSEYHVQALYFEKLHFRRLSWKSCSGRCLHTAYQDQGPKSLLSPWQVTCQVHELFKQRLYEISYIIAIASLYYSERSGCTEAIIGITDPLTVA